MDDLNILNTLVGCVDAVTMCAMKENLDCFLHRTMCLFMPTNGYCPYAALMHTHPAYTFTYHFQPVTDFIVEDRHFSFDIRNGKCLCAISPEVVHEEIEGDYFQSYIAIVIDKTYFEKILLTYTDKIPTFKGEVYRPCAELLPLLKCYMTEFRHYGNEELLHALTFAVTHAIIRSCIDDTSPGVQLYNRFEIDGAIAYMNSHISEKITVDTLAGTANMSAGHFTKIFKEVTKKTPIDFLATLRLSKAAALLSDTRESVTDIAMNCGFSNPSYFCARFSENYGYSPLEYRKRFEY